MHPRIVRISKDPELNMFLNADVHNKPSCPQVLQLRPDNSIYFANAEYTVEHILERVEAFTTPVKFLLLDFQAVGFIDITAVDELRVLHDEIKAGNIKLALMTVHFPVKKVFESSGFLAEINTEYLFEKREEATAFLFKHLDHDYCKKQCPYELFFECPSVK